MHCFIFFRFKMIEKMKFRILFNIMSVSIILLFSINTALGQLSNNNDLLNSDIQALMSNTQKVFKPIYTPS